MARPHHIRFPALNNIPNTPKHKLCGAAEERQAMLEISELPEIPSGVPAIDRLHQDLLDALGTVTKVSDQEFCNEYLAFTKKLERVFRQEEEWMEEIDFAGIKSHQEQHARVLGALHNTFTQVLNGDLPLGRRVVNNLLPQWLLFHMATMDAALAFGIELARAEKGESDSLATNFALAL
jgi:hemerythrin